MILVPISSSCHKELRTEGIMPISGQLAKLLKQTCSLPVYPYQKIHPNGGRHAWAHSDDASMEAWISSDRHESMTNDCELVMIFCSNQCKEQREIGASWSI